MDSRNIHSLKLVSLSLLSALCVTPEIQVGFRGVVVPGGKGRKKGIQVHHV